MVALSSEQESATATLLAGLSTGQLELLFFSSRRRYQDRLLFLYRERVIDRFYPLGPFGFGKPPAHSLLDEAGVILVASSLGVEPKRLGWQRREDWASHTQLAHRGCATSKKWAVRESNPEPWA